MDVCVHRFGVRLLQQSVEGSAWLSRKAAKSRKERDSDGEPEARIFLD